MAQLKKTLKKLLNTIKFIYTPISLIFIGYFTYHNKELLKTILEVADWYLLSIPVCLWCLLHLLAPISPKIILTTSGPPIKYLDLLIIHIARLPARYLPGGIWHTVGRLSAYYAYGVSKKNLTLFALIETFSPCILTLFLGGGYLWLTGDDNMLSSIEGILALINLIILLIIPIIVKWQMPSYWKKNFLTLYLYFILISIVFWIIASTSFLFYYTSVSLNNDHVSLTHVAATYIFSWGVGYISIFAPQGIGVFEVVAGKLLALPLSLGGAVAFVAGFRIVVLAADSLTWISYHSCLFILNKIRTRRKYIL